MGVGGLVGAGGRGWGHRGLMWFGVGRWLLGLVSVCRCTQQGRRGVVVLCNRLDSTPDYYQEEWCYR